MQDIHEQFPVYKSLPMDKGILPKPIKVNKNIEIIREFDPSDASVALFDFDGNISREREGWPNFMVPVNAAFLVAYSQPTISHQQAQEIAIGDIEATIGLPTYIQMKVLFQRIRELGYTGPEINPKVFKDVYNDALVHYVEQRYADLDSGRLSIEDLRMPGSVELLAALEPRLKNGFYIGTGTDVAPIKRSVQKLGFSPYFPDDRIVGAGAGELGPEDCAKKYIVDMLTGKMGFEGKNIISVGDGFPEILYVYLAGGIPIGVVSSDRSNYERPSKAGERPHFTTQQKAQRLKDAGAVVMIYNPFENIDAIVQTVFNGYRHSAVR